MGTKRSKEQIITRILALCQGEGAIKTKIVYQAGFNFRTVVPYLSLLTKKGHIEATEGDRLIYRTTVKGEQALELLLNAEEICY
jgi:predicted transcriptional regulator